MLTVLLDVLSYNLELLAAPILKVIIPHAYDIRSYFFSSGTIVEFLLRLLHEINRIDAHSFYRSLGLIR